MYLTSGRGTLELVNGKAQAFGAVKDEPPLDSTLKPHFKLELRQANLESTLAMVGGIWI